MTANVKEGKLIYLMKNSSFSFSFFFCSFLINLASDQLLLLFLLMSAFTWHFRELFYACVCVYTHLYCVCHSHLYSVVLSVCLDLDRSCVISTSELSVKFSYACKKVRSLTEKKQHRLMDVFFFFFFFFYRVMS